MDAGSMCCAPYWGGHRGGEAMMRAERPSDVVWRMWRVPVLAGIVSLALPVLPAAAQADRPASAHSAPQSPPPVCLVGPTEDFGPAPGNAKLLLASCRGRGFFLGHADEFQVIA